MRRTRGPPTIFKHSPSQLGVLGVARERFFFFFSPCVPPIAYVAVLNSSDTWAASFRLPGGTQVYAGYFRVSFFFCVRVAYVTVLNSSDTWAATFRLPGVQVHAGYHRHDGLVVKASAS